MRNHRLIIGNVAAVHTPPRWLLRYAALKFDHQFDRQNTFVPERGAKARGKKAQSTDSQTCVCRHMRIRVAPARAPWLRAYICHPAQP